jgi:hypothetical protein
MSGSGPLSPGAFAAFLQAKGRRGEGTSYYRKLEAAKKAKMGSKMYERKKMLKMLKKHLTKLIMGVKGVGAAPDWQLAQMRVMMGRCPFRKDCRQNKAIDTGRVEEGARGYGGAGGAKRVLVPFVPGVRRKAENNKAKQAIGKILAIPARGMRYKTALASPRAQARLAEFRALRAVAKAESAKKKMPSAALKALSAAAPPPLLGPYPSLRAALNALSVPRGTALTASKLGDRNIRYGKTKKKLKVGNKNKA